MMIAVAIAGSLVVYAWIMGYIGSSTEEGGKAITIQSVANLDNDLLVFVKNVGEEVVQLEETSCLYVNGVLTPCIISGVAVSDGVATLDKEETATVTLVDGAVLPREKVTIKVTTSGGISAEYSGCPAGNTNIPSALNHFSFNTIESPQINYKPFNLTVKAIDQYNRLFTSYSGVNTLAYSGGTINPTDTGFFVNGVWTGTVTVIGSATSATITTTAESNSSKNGTSNPFDVVPIEPATLWNQTYGGTGEEQAYAMVATSDGGFALAGSTDSFGAGGDDFWLVKTDENGNMEWNRTYGGAGNETAYSLVATSDGGYAMAGGSRLVKTDSFGNMEWNQTYGGRIESLVEASDGGYAMAGLIDSFDEYGHDFWVVKADEFGNMEWNQTYGDGGWAYSLIEMSDGGFAIGGLTNREGEEGAFLVKTDLYGNLEWNRTYQITYMDNDDCVNSLIATSDGGYMLAGRTWGTFYIWRVIKVDQYGFEEWRRTFGEPSPDPRIYVKVDEANSVVETPDGGYLIAGHRYDWVWKSMDDWVIKLDGYGSMQWNQTYGKTGIDNYDAAYAIVATSDGGYAIAGFTTSYGAGSCDFWLIKIDGYGRVP